jgi:hypothetical protein
MKIKQLAKGSKAIWSFANAINALVQSEGHLELSIIYNFTPPDL